MNQKSMIIGAVVLLVFVGGLFYIINAQGSEGWSEDWLSEGETNQGVTGKWFVDVYVVYTDGSRDSLNKQASSLWMENPDGYQVQTIDYVLKAQATRDEHIGTFGSVELDLSNFQMEVKFVESSNPMSWIKYYKDTYDTATIDFGDSETSDIEEIATFSIPLEISGKLDSNGNDHWPLPSNTDTINKLTESWQLGNYQLKYQCGGSIQFRGKNADFGDGEWQEASLPETITHIVTIGGSSVDMDWDSEIIYN